MAKAEDVPIQSLKVKDELISLLIDLDGAGVSVVADRLDKPTSTAHDYLRTLDELGYLVNTNGEYEVSTRYLAIGTEVRAKNDLYTVAKDEIKELSREFGERVLLQKEERGYGVVLYSTENDDALQVDPRPGSRIFLHAGAGGKAILAHFERDRVDRILDERGMPEQTSKTITDREELYDELDRVREQGYAVDRGEGAKGMRSVAVPIAGPKPGDVNAIMAYGPTSSFSDDRIEEEFVEALLHVKDILEFNISYHEY